MASYIHAKAIIEGDITIGENSSVWPGAVIRDDEGPISIGDNCNIQDNCVLHGTVTLGNNVSIGHAAVVHGSTIQNNVLIGMNATILNGVNIGDWCIIAAGSVIPENTTIPPHSLVMGVPGKVVREIIEKDKERINHTWQFYTNLIKNK